MKFLRFDAGQGPRLGVLLNKQVVDLLAAARLYLVGGVSGQDAAFELMYSHDTRNLIEGGTTALHNARLTLKRVEELLKPGANPPDAVYTAEAVRWLPPVPSPSKIIAVGQNYLDHIREQKIEPPKTPILFSKAPTTIIGPGEDIRWPKNLTTQVDPEVELGVIVGKKAKGVSPAQALDYVFGYTVLNDVSARDLQFGDQQWVRGKSLDTFCQMGPVLVTKDEIPDPQALKLSCAVNSRVWQDSSTREMIFSVATLLSLIAQGMTLLPGDVIATGTPHGVGVFQNPPVFLKAGDTLRLEVEKIGVLENPVSGPY